MVSIITAALESRDGRGLLLQKGAKHSKNGLVNKGKLMRMKSLAIIFLGTGVIALFFMIYNMIVLTEKEDQLTWLTTGPAIIAFFCLGASLALYAAYRNRKE